MGVYGIRNPQNNKIFVGFSTDLSARLNRHKTELKFGNHRNRELQQIWDLFGEAALGFEILDTLEHDENIQVNPKDELQILTQMWLQKLEKEGSAVIYLKND